MLVKANSRTVAAVAAIMLGGCSPSEPNYEPTYGVRTARQQTYSFAVHPLHNPALLQKTYGPLIDYLNASTGGARFKLVSSRDYAAFNRRLAAQEFAFALPNPYQTVEATASGYRVFGKVGGDENFRGIILTRRDSPIRTVADLRGKVISYPAPTAVAGTMLPQYFLQHHGVPLSKTTVVYVGSMESSIQSVLMRASDAAAVWPDPWQKYLLAYPERARQLQVRWITPPLVNNGLVVRRDVPPAVADRVLAALRNLQSTSDGQRLLRQLAVSNFEPADDASYDPVRKFLRSFSATVRPLPKAGATHW
jgi:phosphonate transport system substrate-binding protein